MFDWKKLKISRRKLLLSGATGLTAYSVNRGLRYPTLSWSPRPLATVVSGMDCEAELNSLIQLPISTDPVDQDDGVDLKVRAYSPEPSVSIRSLKSGVLHISVENLCATAITHVSDSSALIREKHDGAVTRDVFITVKENQVIELSWELPVEDQFDFAAIGDSGGGVELLWCMQRSKQLGCKFLLHLGDINYSDGEYENAVKLFKKALLPVYVSIGNHDFHDNGLIYQQFRAEIGPMNSAFMLNGVRFVNLDTAADFFPASGGLRGVFAEQIKQDQSTYSDQVVFTHRPIEDPRPGEDHTIGGVGGVEWLTDFMQDIKAETLLAGHIHMVDEREVDGIKQYVSGEGLADDDMSGRKQVAKILIGTVRTGQKVSYRWEPLALPMALHCSPRHIKRLRIHTGEEYVDWYNNQVPESCRTDPLAYSLSLL